MLRTGSWVRLAAIAVVTCITVLVGGVAWAEDAAGGIEGTWQGNIKAAGTTLRLVLHFSKTNDGSLSGTLDSPDQGAMGLPLSVVTLNGAALHLELAIARASYDGTVSGDEIAGTWKQLGASIPLTFRRGSSIAPLRRPQEPSKPYPYSEEEVAFENPRARVHIAGTLTIPSGEAPFPAVVLISGSGPQDRNETISGHKPFLVLADYLTSRGIAVLRTDDRGVGGSTGNPLTSTTRDLASDVAAALAFLKSRPEVDPNRMGLVGHSEGAIIAPMVAASNPNVAFIVLMAGTGLPGEQIMNRQAALIGRAEGLSPASIRTAMRSQRLAFAAIKRYDGSPKQRARIRALLAKVVTAMPGTPPSRDAQNALIDAHMAMLTSPWFRFFLTYDPRPALRKVRCPVLAIGGEKDLQVPARENLREIAKALRAGGNRDATVRVMPRLNHLFQTAKTGAPSEYGRIEETISPAALKVIGDWIAAHTAGPRA